MPDYKALYFKMFRASERAANILITAQQECEALYISDSELVLQVLELLAENKKSVDEA